MKRILSKLLTEKMKYKLLSWRYYFKGDPELKLLSKLVSSNSNVIDVGANIGTYTYHLSRLSAKVYAFEPQVGLSDYLKRVSMPNVEILQKGVSDEVGSFTLNVPHLNNNNKAITSRATLKELDKSSIHTALDIDVVRLDDLNFTDIGFIKIDVEGLELNVLKGAEKLIKATMPNLIVEIENRHLDFPMSQVFDYILSFGYKGFFLMEGRAYPLNSFSYEVHQKPYVDQIEKGECVKEYINNFVFTLNNDLG